jgi:NTP pyrophosphatase (non-canonical NTP hydrolase)
MPKSLKQMEDEVEAYCRQKGWYDQPVRFEQAMALLHEETAEAGHAWREWGLEDHTLGVTAENPRGGGYSAKPQGVGSEFADVLIRMLDDDRRFGLMLAEYLEDDPEIFKLDEEFLVNINTLHGLIAQVTTAWATSGECQFTAFAVVLSFLRQLARQSGINLVAEYERKMDYNHTREYRHGGRRA